jgi:hypothetical protein
MDETFSQNVVLATYKVETQSSLLLHKKLKALTKVTFLQTPEGLNSSQCKSLSISLSKGPQGGLPQNAYIRNLYIFPLSIIQGDKIHNFRI